MKISVDENTLISDLLPTDKAAYLEHFQEKQIYDQTLSIPYPYTEADADQWLKRCALETAALGEITQWGIRLSTTLKLIGGIGIQDGELGYWLAKPYWGKRIMSRAIPKVMDFAFRELRLTQLSARVFTNNPASKRVLEKSGFKKKSLLEKEVVKDGIPRDLFLYSATSSVHADTHL